MKTIFVFVIILFSVVLYSSMEDKDIPLIFLENEASSKVEKIPFSSVISSDYVAKFKSPKGKIELSIKTEVNNNKVKNKSLEAHGNSCGKDCLGQIKQKFFNNIHNKEVSNAILQKLIEVNSPESIKFFSEIIVLAKDTNNIDLLNEINAQIQSSISKEGLVVLIESLLENKDSSYAYSNFPENSKQAITDVINNTNDRNYLIPVLEHAYFADKNLIKGFLSGLDYPEVYSLIALSASEIGDSRLEETAIQSLIEDSSNYSVPAIYLYAEKNQSSSVVEDTYYLAKEWGSRHSNPRSLDVAATNLYGRQSSTATRIASIGILYSMDDKEKLSSILTKVRLHSEDSIVDFYIDEVLLKIAELQY